MNLRFLARVVASLAALICQTAATGCQSSPPPDHGMRGFIIDVAATDEWKANHTVYVIFQGNQIALPAYFEFSPRASNMSHRGKSDSQANILYVQFGGIHLDIETEAGARMSLLSDDEDHALWLEKIITWTVQPLNREHQVAHGAPQSLEELQAQIDSGELAHYINMRPVAR